MFKEDKYIAVKEMLSQEVVDLASQYALIDEMTRFSKEGIVGDGTQVPDAHSKYADPLMESILLSLVPKMEYVTGLTLLPTYSYYRVYRPGMDLKPHIDRPACEISTTVCLKYNYQQLQNELVWPMFVQSKNGPVGLGLAPGDAIVYRGCDIEHWREKLSAPEYSYHIQAFFHYVDANGPHSDQQLDNRLFLGQPKKSEVKPNLVNKNYVSSIS